MILLTLSRGKGEETVRLQLPASPAEIGETFAFLDRISLDTTATAILDVSSNVPVLYRCLYDVDVEDSEQFQKLQKLAERTEALSPAKAAIFSGALDAECVWNLEGALTVADRLDEYMLVNNVSSDSELGIYLVNKGITPFPDRFKPYINYARVGAEYREKHGGEYSSGNYVQKKTPELLENERLDGVFRIWMENPCPVRVQSETAQITLPATFEQLESARQLLGVDSLNMAKLTRVEALRPYLGEYLPLQGMDLRLEQLDELAENIRIMDQEDGALLKYLSVLEVEQPATLQEALRFSIELDDYSQIAPLQSEYKDWDEDLKARHGLEAQPAEEHPQFVAADLVCQRIGTRCKEVQPDRAAYQIPGLLLQYRNDLHWGRFDQAMEHMETMAALSLSVVLRECKQMGTALTVEQGVRFLESHILPHQNRSILKNRADEIAMQFQSVLAKNNRQGIRTQAEKKEVASAWLELAISCAKVPVKYEADEIKRRQKEEKTQRETEPVMA